MHSVGQDAQYGTIEEVWSQLGIQVFSGLQDYIKGFAHDNIMSEHLQEALFLYILTLSQTSLMTVKGVAVMSVLVSLNSLICF